MGPSRKTVAILALALVGSASSAGLADVQKPCKNGTSLGVYHAYSECRTNAAGKRFWYVVTDLYYRCPPANAVQAVRISEIETAQPCDKPAPGAGANLIRELGPGDQSPQADGEFVFMECISGFWYRATYQRHRLPDGSIRISKPAKALHNTLVPCNRTRPSVVTGAQTSTTVGSPKVARSTGSGGEIGGLVVASRQDPEEGQQLLLAAPRSVGGTPVDEVRVELPPRTAKRTGGAILPPGWEVTRKKGEVTVSGPAVEEDEPVAIALSVPAGQVPASLGVELWGDGSRLLAESTGVDPLPPTETLSSLDGVLRLPQLMAPGEEIVFTPLDPTRTPPRGSWEIANEPAEARADGEDPAVVRYAYTLPPHWSGAQLTVRYRDPWGETLVEAAAEETEVVPASAGPDAEPAITGCTPKVQAGGTFCVCGQFPTEASRSAVTLNGEPLGTPISSSSRVLNFQLPAGMPAGPFRIGGLPDAGFAGEQQSEGTVLTVGGEIDRERLMSGESTPLRLWINGTDEPISLRLQNLTPGVVSLDGGEDQMVATSGGQPNLVEQTVNAGTPGDFNINYTLQIDNCPCAGEAAAAAGAAIAAAARGAEQLLADASGEWTTCDRCIDVFRKGRGLSNQARDALLDGQDGSQLATDALAELGKARKLLEQGIEDGSIGEYTAAALDRFITVYETEAKETLTSTTPPAEPDETGAEELTAEPAEYDLKLGYEWDIRLTLDYDATRRSKTRPRIAWLPGDGSEDPRDTGPPTAYGEEDDGPVGIVLLHTRHDWVPRYGNKTVLYAKIYEPDPNRARVWVPSPSRRKVITVRFDSRSTEPGQCLNADLPDGPQNAPDLYLYKPYMHGVTCGDDPTGRQQYGTCTTDAEVNERVVYVKSEDYGGYSKMEALCDNCVPLVPVPMGGDGLYPPAVEERDREKRLVRVPADGNDNQIADGYPPERTDVKAANDDDESTPEGDGTAGDGLSAYEEYRGFLDHLKLHVRTDWNKKTLAIYNMHRLSTGKFEKESGLEVIEVGDDGHRSRVVNYNHGHAHRVDQHCLKLKRGPLPDGIAGRVSDFGPPKNVDETVIKNGKVATGTLVAHELGHSVGMRHHGHVPFDTSKKPEDRDPKVEIRPMTDSWRDLLPGPVHSGPMLCGKKLPAKFSIGQKGDQGSGQIDCIMRYNSWKDVYPQPAGDFDCMPWVARRVFCDSSAGTGANALGRTAGDATKGDCKGQIIVNDGS